MRVSVNGVEELALDGVSQTDQPVAEVGQADVAGELCFEFVFIHVLKFLPDSTF